MHNYKLYINNLYMNRYNFDYKWIRVKNKKIVNKGVKKENCSIFYCNFFIIYFIVTRSMTICTEIQIINKKLS